MEAASGGLWAFQGPGECGRNQVMDPTAILSRLSKEKIEAIIGELNSGQLKAVLRRSELGVKVPPGCVLQKARRKIWASRILEELDEKNDEVSGELFYQWLLNHRRPLLMSYLDALKVKHVRGETEESFTKTIPRERLISEAIFLMDRYDPQDVAIYTLFLDHHQQSDHFSSAERILAALSETQEPTPSVEPGAG